MLSGCVLGGGLHRRSIRRGYKPDCNLQILLVQALTKNERTPYPKVEGNFVSPLVVSFLVDVRLHLLQHNY